MALWNKLLYWIRFRNVKIYNPAQTEIQKNVRIGKGTRIGSMTIIHSTASIGMNCTIGSHCNICGGVIIGENVSIQTGCHITRGVQIGDNCFLGPGIITMNDKYMDGNIQPPSIGSNSRIGGGSAILPDVHIGNNVIVGSCSLVTSDVTDNSFIMGAPAKEKRKSTDLFNTPLSSTSGPTER